jgi:hypothetical protein
MKRIFEILLMEVLACRCIAFSSSTKRSEKDDCSHALGDSLTNLFFYYSDVHHHAPSYRDWLKLALTLISREQSWEEAGG